MSVKADPGARRTAVIGTRTTACRSCTICTIRTVRLKEARMSRIHQLPRRVDISSALEQVAGERPDSKAGILSQIQGAIKALERGAGQRDKTRHRSAYARRGIAQPVRQEAASPTDSASLSLHGKDRRHRRLRHLAQPARRRVASPIGSTSG